MSLLNSHTARGALGGQRSARSSVIGSNCSVRRVGYSGARVQRNVAVKAVEEVGLCAGCRRSSCCC